MLAVTSIYINAIEQVESQIDERLQQIASENEIEIVDFVRKNQLFDRGIDGTGRKLKPYSEFTKKLKRATGLPVDRRTHYQTGKTYNAYYPKLRGDRLFIKNENKTANGFDLGNYLNEVNGGRVYELTEENNDYINDEIFSPKLLSWAIKEIFD